MNRKRLGGIAVVGLWAAVGVIVIACGDDDSSGPTGSPEAGTGVDATPTSTSTSTATTTSTTPGPDTGVPMDAGVDAADARAIWAFNAYCGDAIDSGCPDAAAAPDCPSFDGGGVAGQDCTPSFGRCVSHASDAAVQKGIADRVFVCESVATPVWATTRLCDYENCDNIDAAACPGFGGAGVAGQQCSPERSRCLGNERVFICAPNGLVRDFNGYCDAGLGTRACNEEVDACAPVDGGLSGSACTDEHTRCYGRGSDGNKIFVCAHR